MHRVPSRHAIVPAAWLAVLSLAGCGDRDRSTMARDTAAAGPETGMAADTASADTAGKSAPLTDANIVALLDEANKADSAAGALAAEGHQQGGEGFRPSDDGRAPRARERGQQLAKQLKVTPEPPANDPVTPLAQNETSALESTPKGPEFDRVYIEQEVAAHKAVLDLAENAHEQAQNEQLKALIEKAKPVIQKHLDQAEKIKGELGQATS